MNVVSVTKEGTKMTLTVNPEADWTSCLISATIAALPCFLEAFMKCLSNGGGGETGFKPGDRTRCD